MGKFFGLLACIGTAAMVLGCSNPQGGTAALAKLRAGMDQQEVERSEITEGAEERLQEITERLSNGTCRKAEADQKISEDAELKAVSKNLVAEEQDTTHVFCDGKEINVGFITYRTETAVVIAGPQVATVITSVEVESDRTCAKLESETKVADVEQDTENKGLILEADGDVRLPISNSNLVGMTVAEGKNLLKLKYFECAETKSTVHSDGSTTIDCIKKNLLDEKEVVLNVTITKERIEGVRKLDKCEKPADKPKTGDQE